MNQGYNYDKQTDTFSHNNRVIYQSGKWAKKLPERVEVVLDFNYMSIGEFSINWFIKNGTEKYNSENEIAIAHLLTKQLEKYLNNEINE